MKTQRKKDRGDDPSAAGVRRADGHREHDQRVKTERAPVYERRAAEGKPLFEELRQ